MPPLADEAVRLLKLRMRCDCAHQYTEGQLHRRAVYAVLYVVFHVAAFSMRDGWDGLRVNLIVGAALLALVALVPVVNRRQRAKYGALLEDAGFRRVTDHDGRVWYEPPAD
ncbi:hypothetical protein [Streptomyces roseicoloratus]|uniref:hypothetical protein n=1 Tax=Streptomyces roseicoloratus TaxID=2508722 RepID=UPI001009D72A|nr:hypothetical protein [Streptomyces roseicoloratus]